MSQKATPMSQVTLIPDGALRLATASIPKVRLDKESYYHTSGLSKGLKKTTLIEYKNHLLKIFLIFSFYNEIVVC